MSEEALKFKNSNPDLDYKNMSLNDLEKLPKHNGIINFKISKTSFLMLNILNDDSSVIKYFWKGSHDLASLDLWYNLSLKKGVFIDVGAHTGLYSLVSSRANKDNQVISFEPYFLNMARLITNLRLNGIFDKVKTILAAVSNFDGKTKFNINSEKSYLSKGGKIDKNGIEVDVYALDNILFDRLDQTLRAIKIDTEGEDYKVLLGSEKLISQYKPKIIIEVREENKLEIKNFFKKYKYKTFNIEDLKNEIDLEQIKINNMSNIFAQTEN